MSIRLSQSSPRPQRQDGRRRGCQRRLLSRLFALEQGDEARVVAEPSLSNYAMLRLNTHDLPSVTPLRAALWTERASLLAGSDSASSWAFGVKQGNNASHTVAAAPIDLASLPEVLDLLCVEQLDFLKMDIEGAEGSSLRLARARGSTGSPTFTWRRTRLHAASGNQQWRGLRGLAAANMTVLTNPNFTRALAGSRPTTRRSIREYIFLACAPRVPRKVHGAL